MESLADRFDALQELILKHIESDSTSLQSHIAYWGYVRKENALMHVARQQGLTRIGLQPLPTLTVTEYNAKQAITIQLTLQSLLRSPYGSEQWKLSEVSAELINTPPQNLLKKHGFSVEVWFDNDKNNAMVYTNWNDMYYQDAQETWHKVHGSVDYNGLYFTDHNGERAYFTLFDTDAIKYSRTGHWTVHYKTHVISSSVVSSTTRDSSTVPEDTVDRPSTSYSSTSTAHQQESPARRRVQRTRESPKPSSTTSPETRSVSLRRRRGEGESRDRDGGETPTKRRRRGGQLGLVPTAEEVGSRHRTPETTGLSRLGQLQAEAWDPPIILVRGLPNTLKCWRYRKYQNAAKCFWKISTVFNWVSDNDKASRGRLIIAFKSVTQRECFVKQHLFPKGATYTYGQLNGL
ncbi:E2 [Human papillomavirus type 183]|nr:E2 [Human papillomavirus type 183]